jgi:hypothetical protein
VKEGFGQPLAETSEVAELVRQLTAEKLSARRARVEEARELRARMGKLVESAAHISPDSVSPERSRAEETQLLSGSDLVSVTRAAPEQVQTDTTSSVPTRDKAPVSRIRWLALAVVASVIVVVVVFSLRRSASNAANPEAVRVASAPIPSPSPPTSAPADPRERAPAPVVTPSADKRKSKPPTHVRKPSATPSLPDNPYEN